MIFKKWLSWMTEKGDLNRLYHEVGDDNDISLFMKKASKSNLYLDYVNDKIMPGEIASSEIGNMYSASIFMSFLSLLSHAYHNNIELKDNTVGFISYGSGSKSKVFEGVIQAGWRKKVKGLKLFEILNRRNKIDIEVYEKLHRNQISIPLSSNKGIIKLSKIESKEFNLGLRKYKYLKD